MSMRASPWPTNRQGADALWRSSSRSASRSTNPSVVSSSFIRFASVLGQAGVDHEIGAGAAGALVGGEKQRDAGDVAGIKAEFQRLQVEELLVQFWCEPKFLLTFSQDGAGNDAVDADAF